MANYKKGSFKNKEDLRQQIKDLEKKLESSETERYEFIKDLAKRCSLSDIDDDTLLKEFTAIKQRHVEKSEPAKKKLRQRIVSLKDKLYRLVKQERYTSTSNKFFKGLCFESAGVALNKHGEFISTSEVIDICNRISPIIKMHPEWLYTIGHTVFKNSFLSEHPHVQENYEILFGQKWKKIRFRSLVRIGGDVLNTDIASVKNPVLTGALWYHYHPSQVDGPLRENKGKSFLK